MEDTIEKTIELTLKPGFADKLKKSLSLTEYEDAMDKIELSIMENVQKCEGSNILEKIDNYNDMCKKLKESDSKEFSSTMLYQLSHYQMKHRGAYLLNR